MELVTVSPPGVAAAFYVAPQVGYQEQTFIMGTVDHAMLDYEVEEFQHIVIRVNFCLDHLCDRLAFSLCYSNLQTLSHKH